MTDLREELSPDQWGRVKELFGAALERASAERAAFLDAACGPAEGQVRREVEALLATHQTSDTFLDTPAAPVATPLTPTHGTLTEGQMHGPYRVLRTLGHGGMATVYLARDERHRRSVALKVLHPDVAHALGRERFLREIEVAANLSHPHILPLHDSGEAGGLLYYVMPHVEGLSLRERLDRETQLPLEDGLQIAREVADALAYAHGQGVIHRDIKPENILLSGGHALVADFGIARVLGHADSAHLTGSGMAIGTAAYMSPEQAKAASHIDGRSDVYSLGCVVYEMLAGEPPYTGPTAQAIIAKRFHDPLPSVRHVRPSVPESVDRAVSRSLALVAADRFGTAAEFARALQPMAATPPATAAVGEVLQPRRRGSRTVPIVVGAVLALGLAALVGVFWRHRTPIRSTNANVVAVAPFQVSGADPALAYLREGMVDLLAAKLTGRGGPRAADPRAALSGWRRASRSDGGDLPQGAALEVAERLGAGQLLIGNVVGTPSGISLNASLLTVPSGREKARATVEGQVDSLSVLVDRLTAQLLTLGAGEGEQRLSSLMSASLPALRAYLEGQATFRRGRYGEAMTSFDQALQVDSTFSLAALGLLAAAARTGAYEPVRRGSEIAFAARDRLNSRDRAYLMVLMGSTYDDTIPQSQLLRNAERFVQVAPDRAEAYVALSDILLNFGEMLGVPAAHVRAAAACRRALELDSTYAPALDNLALLASRSGDTRTVRHVTRLYRAVDSVHGASTYVRWRMAVALGDGPALDSIRSGLDSADVQDLTFIGQLGQYDGVGLEDAERAQRAWLARESRGRDREAALAEMSAMALNRGRPAEARRARQEESETASYPWGPWSAYMEQVMDAMYWDGDTIAGAAAARWLQTMADSLAVDKRGSFSCLIEQWRLAHGQLSRARHTIEEMRSAQPPGPASGRRMRSQGCVVLLGALLAAAERRSDAGVYLARLDSLMRTGPPYVNYDQYWNLVVARLKESRGDVPGALAATRRRLYFWAEPFFLSTYLREEGRLAALTGDRPGAIRAYQHYLVLRAHPEPALRPQVEQVRSELGQLLSESGRSTAAH